MVHSQTQQRFYSLEHGTFYQSKDKVKDELGRGDRVPDETGKKQIFPIEIWFRDRPPSSEVKAVLYSPGKPARYRAGGGDTALTLNAWRPGPFHSAKPNDSRKAVAPFLDYIAYLTASLTDEQRAVLLDWMAYPLQNLGAKTGVALVLVSETHGTGKSTLANIMTEIYGKENIAVINGSELKGNFNDYTQRQLLVVEEVHVSHFLESQAIMNKLKMLVTDTQISLNRKFMPQENVPNHVNVIMISNHPDALKLEESDRRFFVVAAPEQRQCWSKKRFIEFYGWLKDGGYRRVYRYLLSRDLNNFNPHMDAPHTKARTLMIQGNSTVVDDVAATFVATPAEFGIHKDSDELYEPVQIVRMFLEYMDHHKMERPRQLTVAKIGSLRALKDLPKKSLVLESNGTRRKLRLYAVTNREHWATAPTGEWRRTYKKMGRK